MTYDNKYKPARRICGTMALIILLTLAARTATAQTIFHVTPDGNQGSTAWEDAMTLTAALDAARAGDQIWVQGFETIDGPDKLYTVPDDVEAFTVRSGVSLYGGFRGDETSIDERVATGKLSEMRYRSVLSGDRSHNDAAHESLLIFPGNTTRDDNAAHVVVMDLTPTASSGNNNTLPTVIDGFSIAEGHADGNPTDKSGWGGGIFVTGDNSGGGAFSITRCFLVNNYARRGGAVYVDRTVKVRPTTSTISYNTVFNNAAGERSSANNSGGGLYVAGAANVVNCEVFNNENGGIAIAPAAAVINSTVARNTGSGIEKIDGGTGDAYVYNTVIWGNSYLYSTLSPTFYNSSYHEVELTDGATVDANGNRYVSDKNRGDDIAVPMFESPSLRTSYDREFNWRTMSYPLWSWDIQEGSAFIDGGDGDMYDDRFGTTDMAGQGRLSNGMIDIGAYEYQAIPASRIRYVKPGGSDMNSGDSWDAAYRTIQHAIDALAATPGMPGEVWVAAGTYEPTTYLEDNPNYPASFRMSDGISVYGGFEGTETSKADRKIKAGGMPWDFANVTILQGQSYSGEINWNSTDNRWSLNSASTHVVWFAPLLNENKSGFDNVTILDGVTVRGGQATTSQADYYNGDRGAGIYMCVNAWLTNSVVTENVAQGDGGAVWLSGGRVMSSLLFNNSSDSRGGAIYMDRAGIVLRSMLANNSAYEGAGIYMDNNGPWTDGLSHPEYLILSTSIVSNNTSSANGAVYCNKGGVVLQSTITNNSTPRATDMTDENASQSGGLYIDTYTQTINTVLWNNRINGANIQVYVKNPSPANVRFLSTAVASMNNVVWNNTVTEGVLSLSDTNTATGGQLAPGFSTDGKLTESGIVTDYGVQGDWITDWISGTLGIDHYWQPVSGSNLRAQGAVLGTMPDVVLIEPEQDLGGSLFAQKPSIGAWEIAQTALKPEQVDGSTLRLYVDVNSTDPDHDGSSWDNAYRSLNEAIAYFASLPESEVGGKQLEIYVKEGDLFPIYAFGNLDPKTATLDIKKTASRQPLRIVGGWSAADGTTRDPLTCRSILEGNQSGTTLADGLYHVVMVEPEANVVLDGFYVTRGYAAGTATITGGAGMLIYDNATVEVRNSVFENNTAVSCAAIDGRQQGVTLTLVNCVINNNTNTDTSAPVVAASTLHLNHVTMVNNIGAAYTADSASNSFAAGNTSGDTMTFDTMGEAGAANFTNPSNVAGAVMGHDTYYGGYADWTPLTGSDVMASQIINCGMVTAGLDNDIAMHGRDLGGVPDIGAYEAALPESGRVYYVRTPGDGGSDANSGLSWDAAFATIRKAVEAASRTEVIDGEKAQVWVAAGTYEQDPQSGSDNCFEIVEAVNVYGAFPRRGNPSMDERRPFISDEIYYDNDGGTVSADAYETILRPATDNNDVRRVLGQADMFNPFSTSTERYYFYVGGGQGNYDIHGDEVVGKLNMPAGNYVYAAAGSTYYEDWNLSWVGWEGENPKVLVYVGSGFGEYLVKQGTALQNWRTVWAPSSGGGYSEFKEAGYYLCSDDVATHYSDGQYMYSKGTSGATPVEGGDYVLKESEFTYPTTWDGFTIRDGYIDSDRLRFLDNNIDSSDRSGGKRNGGAGAAIFTNVTLANSIVYGNYNRRDGSGGETRGGGVYCDEGTLVNCYVLNNTLGDTGDNTGYGAGVYMFNGTAYNCVIANNEGNAKHSDGAGVLVDNNNIFFNNTIVGNKSNGGTRGAGGVCIWQDSGASSSLVMYNCVVLSNSMQTIGTNVGDENVAAQNGEMICYNSIVEKLPSGGTYGNAGKRVRFVNCQTGTNSIFEGYGVGNYRLDGDGDGSIAINRGENEPVIDGETYFLMDYTDMDFTARIKDCTIDAGAYEFEQTTATPSYDNDTRSYVYFVTQNGAGNASGSSPDNAACATKLQIVLNAAGERVRAGQPATVRLGVPQEAGFTFTANTLSNANDPQSYTFVVPYGVQLEGGWDEDFNTRNPYNYPTSLSPVATVGGVTVNGYHAVTFGEPQTDQGGRTVIDGVVLRDGQATSESGTGNSNARGGGAIVPSWGHVRNCVVSGNRALQGGGLYVMPGGLVTGTLVISNTAEQGAGIYADGTGVTEKDRAHLVSVTVTDNEASSAGGGLYLEDGAAMTVNAVVWGNTAPSDKNVSGVLNTPFADAMLSAASGGTIDEFYPMNNCFVETYEIPGNFANTSLESGDDAEVKYFVVGSGTGRTLKDFSPMIKHGSSTSLVQYMITNHGMASTDMQGIARIQGDMDKVDGGAYAFDGGTTSLKNVVTRLFVSQTKTVALADGYNEADYRGKSFFTPFTWLDDALLYIEQVRDRYPGQYPQFEILMAGGTYKPHYRRTAGDPAAGVVDQRLSSFVIPQGVNIYGGFSGNEEIASEGVTEIPAADGTITVADGGDINALANAREMSDLNVNGVLEAWEFANQTILSGQINEGAARSQNVEHVVYTEGDGQIMLDGLTVNYGDATSGTTTGGAGIYSDGVDCIVKGCRLLNCSAVNGGAVYVRDAGLTLLSSIVAGNRATASGGAVYVEGVSATASLDAANTVFANNEAASNGGAVATNQTDQTGGTVNVSLINTLMVRNSAGNCSAIFSQPFNTRITNSVIWGNSADRAFNLGASSFSHSASDDSYFAANVAGNVAGNDGNIALNTVNLAIDGPRFRSPSTVAGASGNSTSALWNPAAISVLTDTGDGQLAYGDNNMANATGGYHDWWDGKTVSTYSTFYMGDAGYDRYAGPRPTQDTDPDPKVIDMGAYEYQYKPFDLDDVYVDLQERGDGSGSSWDNATTDLRGAISALASGDYAGRKPTKTVHIRAGEYSPQQLNGGVAYHIQMAGATNANISVLNIRGAYDETGNQDFGNPTRFVVNPAVGQANTLLSVNVNTKEVNIEGISFEGASQNGMFITNGLPGDNTTPRVTVRNSAFRGNGTGVYFDQAVAGTDNLFVNTLFADGGTGIDADNAVGQVTVVNATFAKNTGAAIEGNADVYNSMSWRCGTGLTTDDANHNRDFAAIDNSDVANGPNFVNPAGGDYNIRPSIMVLDMGSIDLYDTHAGKDPAKDYDLDGAPRLTGDKVDLGAYEYDAELRQVLYVRSGVAGSDESGDSWENAMSDLQGAVDLASIYHNKNNSSDGYVFVHNNVTAADGLRVSMPGVKVYGGMNGESTKGTPADVLARRGSFLNYQRQSTLHGLDITAASVVDGFTITGDVTVGSEGVLSTSVLSSSATAKIDGLLYNSFVEGTVTGKGEAVNVTTPGTLGVATKKNVVENAVTNGYVTAPVWKYQLKEDSPSIDGGTEGIASYIDKVGHSEDLSGTSRVRGIVDNGCFETWRITSPETIKATDRPTASHVVYVEPGQELSLATGLTTEASPFNVGFLLLQHGAGLVGGGNWVSLGNLAVERTLGGEAGDSWDMAYMPFTITSTTVDGTAYDAAAGTVAVQTYDGRARAAYNYQFSATDGAWSDILPQGNTGMLLTAADGAEHTVRFYGNSYTESSDAKSVRLTKYNYNDPWASPDDGGDRFTHAENMSWNMFGSPFLCGMNYSDMEYGRVIYRKSGNTFASVNTMDDDAAGGALGAGSAVLTQTATLADYETFEIAPRSATLGDDTARSGNLAVSVMRGDSEAADEFVLTAVPGDEASETFSLANDGVKMMSVDTTASQVYMMRDGHRYSMLSAVDVEGTVPVGLRLTDAGSYAIAIPDDCPAYDYETVILTDNATGRVVDLLDAPYRFNVAAGGDVEGRFTLQFNTSLSEGVGTVNVYSDSEGNVIVEGLETGMRIRLYDASGRMTANRIAASPTETFTGCERGVCLVQVIDGDSEPQVFKAMVGR